MVWEGPWEPSQATEQASQKPAMKRKGALTSDVHKGNPSLEMFLPLGAEDGFVRTVCPLPPELQRVLCDKAHP